MGGEREKRKKDRNKRERKKERKRFKKPDRNVSFPESMSLILNIMHRKLSFHLWKH